MKKIFKTLPVMGFLVALIAAPLGAGTSASAFTTSGLFLTPAAPTIEFGSGSPELTFTIEKKNDYDFHKANFSLKWAGSFPIHWILAPTCPEGQANATADLSLCGISSFVATSTDGPMPNPLPVQAYSDQGGLKMIFDTGWQSGWTTSRDTTYTLVFAQDAFTVPDFNPLDDDARLDAILTWCTTPAPPVGGVSCAGAGDDVYYSRFSFDANGGTGTMPDIVLAEGLALPPNGFSKPGFEFAGWVNNPEWAHYCDLDAPSCIPDEWVNNGGRSGTLFAVWRVAGSGPTPPTLPTWSAAEDVSLPLENAESAQVTVDGNGLATAVWSRYNGSNDIVQSSTSLNGGAWTTPVDLSATGQNGIIPQVTVDADGTATAVWVRNTGSGTSIQSSTRPSGGTWSSPADNLSVSGLNAFNPQVTVDVEGTAIAVWSRSNGTNTIIQSSTRPSGGSWSTPVDLSAPLGDAENPQVTVDATGTAIAVWSRSNGTNTIIQSSTRPIGGPWSTPVDDLSAAGQNASAPQVTVDSDGTATAVWIRSNGTNDIVQSSTRPSGGPWSTPEDVSEPLGSATQPQVTVDPTGLATAVWTRYDGSNFIVQSCMRPSDGSWSDPADDLSLPLQDALAPQIAAGANGRVVAVWEQGNGSNTIIQSKSFDNAAAPNSGSGGESLAVTGVDGMLSTGVATVLFMLACGAVLARSQFRFVGSRTRLLNLRRRAGLRD